MGKQTVTVTRRVKKQDKKDKAPKGTHPCPSCNGTGYKMNVGRKPK